MKQDTSETTSPNNKRLPILKKIAWNKYSLAIILFIIWMIFFDNTSWLVIRELDKEINKYEEQVNFYKNEFEKNDKFYKKLMLNKSEKEKFARENYFMKKSNEEIFIRNGYGSCGAVSSLFFQREKRRRSAFGG